VARGLNASEFNAIEPSEMNKPTYSFETIDPEQLRQSAPLKWGRWPSDTISLSVADIDFPTPKFVLDGVRQALDEERTPYRNYHGDADVLAVLCEKLNRKNKIPATPQDVFVVPGTMFSIFLTTYYALRPGDEAIITPAPVYPPFMEDVANARGQVIYNPAMLVEGRWRVDLDDLERRISAKTKLLMVCNPHNPLGMMLHREELERIGELAKKYDLLIFSDELYEDMTFESEHLSLASFSADLFARTLSVFGVSKTFGVPGFRVAYLVNRGRHMAELRRLMHGMIVHTDTLAQAALKAAVAHGGPWLAAFVPHLKAMRDHAVMRLNAVPGIQCAKPEATPFVFADIRAFKKTSREMTDYLRETGRVVVECGSDFGPDGEGFIRLHLGTSRANLDEALTRMTAALEKLRATDIGNQRKTAN